MRSARRTTVFALLAASAVAWCMPAAPASAAQEPVRNGKLLLDMGGYSGLFMHPYGSQVAATRELPGQAAVASATPDGRRIAYLTFDGHLGIRTLGTSDGRIVTLGKGLRQPPNNPAPSPDGRYIVFERQRGLNGLWIADTETGAVRRLTTTVPAIEVESGERHEQPTWSPDGTLIAFHRRSLDGITQIMTVRPNGRGLHAITSPSRGEGDRSPEWSPDSQTLAFTTTRFHPVSGSNWREWRELATVHRDGTGFRRLTVSDDAYDYAQPAWSPDGKEIVVQRYTPYNAGYYLGYAVYTVDGRLDRWIGQDWTTDNDEDDTIRALDWLPARSTTG